MLQLRILESAARELASLDRPTAARVVTKVRWLAGNFDKVRPEPLTGQLAGLFKLRVGPYRVIYEVLSNQEILVVHAVGHRREVYRK